MAVSLPRFPLAALPTPLVRLDRLGAALGVADLYAKRDDLTGFALAGNKARQLECLVADALARGCDVLVAAGGPASNFCAAAAAAASVAGLECVLVLYGSPDTGEPAKLRLARSFGAEVHFTGSIERASVDAELEGAAARLRASGRRPYPMPRGGATAVGAAGQALALAEAAGQLRSLGIERATFLVACGSGGTQAGLVAGAAADRARWGGWGWRVTGASVSRGVGDCRRRVLDLSRECAALLAGPRPAAADVEIVDARGPGFALPSAEGEAMAHLAARTEGLLLDPTYTAKALGTLPRFLGEAPRGPVVFWHTGGVGGRLLAAAGDGGAEAGVPTGDDEVLATRGLSAR
ncbi:MAG: 1-aminocyclopropane-1-carboxylate deaminase/D-cysteine desulfhydrase [Acidimicrobiales bacterium]